MHPLIILIVLFISQVWGGIIQITGINKLNVKQTQAVIQMVDMEYYTLANQIDLQYVIFEIKFDESTMEALKQELDILPILCYDFENFPVITFENQKINLDKCKGFNFNQYSRANGQYFIKVDVSEQSFVSLKFGVFITGVQVNYEYTIRVSFPGQENKQCPFDCYNQTNKANGRCDNGTCECENVGVDEDCSYDAKYISSKSSKLVVDSNAMKYAYYRPDSKVKDINDASNVIISISLMNKSPPVDFYVCIQGSDPQKIIPTKEIYLKHDTINTDEISFQLTPIGQYNEEGEPRYTVIGFIVKTDDPKGNYNEILISINEASDDLTNTNMIIIYFLVGVVSLLFLIWIILTIIKIRYSRRNQILDVAMAQAQFNAAQQRAQQRRGQSTKLTIEIIDQFLPCYTFEEIKKRISDKGKILNDSCAVCLCEFESVDQCRETICNHYFHKDCLEQWLKKQENCPFCRTELTRASLVKHFEQIKVHSEQPGESNSGQPQENNLNVSNNMNDVQASFPNRNNNEQSPLRNQIIHSQSHQPSNANLIRLNERNQSHLNVLQPAGNALLHPNSQNERRQMSQLNVVVQRNLSSQDINQQPSSQLQLNFNQNSNLYNSHSNGNQQSNNQMQVQELDAN